MIILTCKIFRNTFLELDLVWFWSGKGGDGGRVEWKGRQLFSGFAVKTFPLHLRHFPRWNRCSHWCDRSSLHTARLRHGACKWGHTLIVSVQNKQTIKQCGDISIKMVKILLLQQHLLLEKRANRQSCTNYRLCSSRTPCLEATSKIHDTRTCCTRWHLLFFTLYTHNDRLPFHRSGLKRQSSHTSCFRHAFRLSPTCSSSSHYIRNRNALLQQQ